MTSVTLCTYPLLSLGCRKSPLTSDIWLLEPGITWSPKHQLPRNPKVLPISQGDLQPSNHDTNMDQEKKPRASPHPTRCGCTTALPPSTYQKWSTQISSSLALHPPSPPASVTQPSPSGVVAAPWSCARLWELGLKPHLAAGGTPSTSAKGAPSQEIGQEIFPSLNDEAKSL